MPLPGKRPVGRPKGYVMSKVKRAVLTAESAALSMKKVDEIVAIMNPSQKGMFESIMVGDMPVVTALKSGNTQWFTGLCKYVYTDDDEQIKSTDLTLEDIPRIKAQSLDYLNRLAASQINMRMMEEDYQVHTAPIREQLKKFAPLALGTVLDVMQNAKKAEVRLKAANSLLDRAGEREPEPESNVVVPVQVNITLTKDDGTKSEYAR